MVAVTDSIAEAPAGAGFNKMVDHISRFTGLAVGNLYLLAAGCTLWEVFARYILHHL